MSCERYSSGKLEETVKHIIKVRYKLFQLNFYTLSNSVKLPSFRLWIRVLSINSIENMSYTGQAERVI